MIEENPGLAFAKRLAAQGWRVYPGFVSKDDEKVPYSGKGGSWVKLASCDPAQLEEWWSSKPYLWPGVVSGAGSCIVIDADGPDAVNWLREQAKELGWSQTGLIYRTPGKLGGLHAIYDFPSFLDPTFRLAKVLLPTGGVVELRGGGCWTLTAGARRKSGVYEIISEPPLMGTCDAPRALLEKIVADSVTVGFGGGDGSLRSLSPEEAWAMAPLYDGRKNVIAGLAWNLAIKGEPEEVVDRVVNEFNRECCVPPCSQSTVDSKVRYAVARATKAREQTMEAYQRVIDAIK